ncbi:hypothetical protein VE04_04893 [Pseudogymnoascus sp. 24MN13]|nr:hypothetical protein VE04_04893 [Pseudogymnoascus sp. 24MN13]
MSSNKASRKKSPTRKGSSRSPAPKDKVSAEQPLLNGAAAGSKEEHPYENIFLFWPNIIGYVRIVLALGSLYYMPLHPRTCTILYSVSCLLDALDGYAARYFSQSTRFGAVLDMVTDRCTTACLLVFLASAFPRWSIVFQGLISLDLASHYMHMYATLVMGGAGESHKKSTTASSTPGSLQPGNPSHPSAASMSANTLAAGALELARANKLDSFWPWVLAGASFPVMAGKQIINVVQLVKASRWLGEGDREERRVKGLPLPRKK